MINIKWFIHTALSYLGTPYQWGGDDPSGFDCSGLVVECLKTAGLMNEDQDLTADGLLQMYTRQVCERPKEGTLMFLLNERGRAYHVEICLDEQFRIGASGGGSATTSVDTAWSQNAFIKIRPIGSMHPKKKFVYPF